MANPETLLPRHQVAPAPGAPPAKPLWRGGGGILMYPEVGLIPIAIKYGACLLYRGGNNDCFDDAYFFVLGLLIALLLSLARRSMRAPPRSDARLRLKLATWAVDTAVIFAGTWWFTRRAVPDDPMPLRFAAPLWATAVAVSALTLHMCARRD